MFGDLLKRLVTDRPEPASDGDARLALGALLVRVARADGDYDADEARMIEAVLARRYGLDATGATQLRSQCEVMESEAPDTVRFTRAIKEAVSYEDREAVIAALWEIVLADGVRDDAESALMRMVAPLLGVGDAESNRIRMSILQARS